jgi:hypothetical protein
MSMVEPAAAQTETGSADAGDVVVADPVNVNRALREGDSTSAFTFRLPEGASCPGDSANDDWRVSTFLVPADTNLDTLTYQALRPDGEAYRSLRYLDGDIYVMEMTNANPGPGEPGLITPIPPLTMAWFETGSLEAGPYKMGIACTDASGAVQRYWDTAVELTTAPDVDPGGLRWSVEPASGASSQPSSSSSGSTTWMLPVVALVVVVGGVVLIRRRQRRPSLQSQPSVQSQKESV